MERSRCLSYRWLSHSVPGETVFLIDCIGDLIVRGTAHVASTTTYLEDLDCSPLSYLTVSENDNNCYHPICMGNSDGTTRMFPTFLSFLYGPNCGGLYR